MKKLKKHPRKQLEKFSNIFMQLGLVLVLFVVFVTLEHQTEKGKQTAVFNHDDSREVLILDHIPREIVVEKKVVEQPKQQQRQQRVILDEPIDKVKNDEDIKETVLIPKEEDKVVINEGDIYEVDIPEEVDKSDDPVSMNFVQKAPVFKGCEGLSEVENRKCFEKKMKRLVRRHFNADLANELGLSSGKKSIYTQFVIDKNGNVVDIRVKAPHPRLMKEASRIVKKIPKFKPGIQNDKPVKVKYMLPISFMVE
ncbi:energy transducer TonB [Tenacibaculum sp. 190524A05c]|uniref:energy transducer TonB n=1 Tax=Tenacibaculum platacis TaxID=3137852 RepID=UPI0032B190FB